MIKNIIFKLIPLFIKISPSCLYPNSIFIIYKKPPKIILTKYKNKIFFNVYFKSLYPKLTKHIIILK